MVAPTINKRILLQQFLIWWGMYLLFMAALILWMITVGRTKNADLFLIVAALECTAMGSLMAIAHYYGLYQRYFVAQKYLLYFFLLGCFIGIFVLLDAVLFYFQIGGERFFADGLSRVIFVVLERVMIAYLPVALIYTFSRNTQYRRKQRRIAKFAQRIS